MKNPTALLLALIAATAPAAAQTARDFGTPPVTTWSPEGCRAVPYTDAVIPPAAQWTNLHGDIASSDQVSIALAPTMREAWTVEGATYNVTGPIFDGAGNLYFSPLAPYDGSVLISIEPDAGARRWAIAGTGAPTGGSAPMLLRDPDVPGAEIIYLALYDRVLAVRTDGSVVWDVPSGLTLGSDPLEQLTLGTSYIPSLDAVAGLTKDGWIFVVDRRTGAQLLNAPFQLPGAKTPPAPPSAIPPATFAAAEDLLQVLVDSPNGVLRDLIDTLLGNDTEVANMFSVDPRTGRLWVAATAPDAEDGTADGVSALGALYRLELQPSGSAYDIVEVCHRSFAGGSASTPTLDASGGRIYLGDNFGKLLAVRDDCSDAWELDLGAQIFGSVSVPNDKGEIFASSAAAVTKVTDAGAAGVLEWTAAIDPFENLTGSQVNFNVNLITTAANGLAFQAGAGVILAGTSLPATVGVGMLDRETGAIASFVEGGEETVAVMSAGPDGALYMGNSPLRRLFAQVLGLSPAPIRGGITKFEPERHDLVVRDAACAAERRARNAKQNAKLCPDSAEADRVQVLELTRQASAALAIAIAAGEVPATSGARYAKGLAGAEERLDTAGDPSLLRRSLGKSRSRLRRVCRKVVP